MKNGWKLLLGVILSVAVLQSVGCGGGGGGGVSVVTPASVVKFRTYSGASQAPQIESIQFRILLPAGVTVATDPSDPRLTAPGVLKLSGVFASTFSNMTSKIFPRPLFGSYSTAKPAGSGPNAIRVLLSLSGNNPALAIGPGGFLTVNGTAAPGTTVAASSFGYSELVIVGSGGTDLTNQYKFAAY